MRARDPFIVALAAGLIVGLAACAPERSLEDNSSTPPTSSASSSPTPDVTNEPEEPAEPAETNEPPTPVTQSCDEFVSAQTMYDYNPNFSFVSQGKANYEGVACNWINGTSSEKIALTVARPGATDREAIAAAAATGTPAPALGSSAYFSTAGGAGTATVIDGDYVIVVSSPYFLGPEDVQPLVASVQEAL